LNVRVLTRVNTTGCDFSVRFRKHKESVQGDTPAVSWKFAVTMSTQLQYVSLSPHMTYTYILTFALQRHFHIFKLM
jgi:hypothetical protein